MRTILIWVATFTAIIAFAVAFRCTPLAAQQIEESEIRAKQSDILLDDWGNPFPEEPEVVEQVPFFIQESSGHCMAEPFEGIDLIEESLDDSFVPLVVWAFETCDPLGHLASEGSLGGGDPHRARSAVKSIFEAFLSVAERVGLFERLANPDIPASTKNRLIFEFGEGASEYLHTTIPDDMEWLLLNPKWARTGPRCEELSADQTRYEPCANWTPAEVLLQSYFNTAVIAIGSGSTDQLFGLFFMFQSGVRKKNPLCQAIFCADDLKSTGN